MKKPAVRKPETPSLRDAHKDLTRTRILDSAIDFLSSEPLDALTIAAVARKAAVTERTVYRHFQTREELLASLWPRLSERAAGAGFPDTPQELARQPRTKFQQLEKEEVLSRFLAFSRQGQELRLSANDQRQKAVLKAVAEARPDLGRADQKRLAALCHLLNSSYAWASLKDFWGMDARESGPAASEAIEALMRGFLKTSR